MRTKLAAAEAFPLTCALVHALLVFLLTGALGAGCGDDDPDDGGGGASDVDRPDESEFAVTWKPGTVVVSQDDVDGSLVDPFVSDGVYTFAAPPESLSALAPQQLVVLSGLGVFRVLRAERNEAGELVLTTEEAALQEAAEEGRISWNIGLGAGRIGRSGLALVTAPLEGELPVPPGYERTEATPFNAEFTVGRVKAKVVYSKTDDGQHQLDLTLTGNEGISVSGKAKVKFRGFRQTGLYEFTQSRANLSIGYDSFDVSGEVQFDLTEVNGALKVGKNFGLVYPFMVGPIPMYVQLGAGFEIESTLANNGDTARAMGSFAWAGKFGVDVIPGISQTPFVQTARGESDLGEAAHVSQVTTGVNVNFDAPRIDFGVGLVPPAPAHTVNMDEVNARVGFFAKIKSELVQNMEVLIDPLLGTVIGHCLKPASNFGLFWGGEMRFFNVRTSTEQLVYGIEKEGTPSGTACK